MDMAIVLVFAMLFSVLLRRKFEYTCGKAMILCVVVLLYSLFFAAKIPALLEGAASTGLYAYGAVALLPIIVIPIAKLFKISALKTADYSAVILTFIMLFEKVNCWVSGCCLGIELFELSDGTIVNFPSRSLEAIVFAATIVLFYKMSCKVKYQGLIYGYFAVIYGIQRAIFEELRFEQTIVVKFGVHSAQIWSLACIIIGVLFIVFVPKTKAYKTLQEKFELSKV